VYQNLRQTSLILEAKYLFGIKLSFSIAVALLTACVWAQYFRLSSKRHFNFVIISIFYVCLRYMFRFFNVRNHSQHKNMSFTRRRPLFTSLWSVNLSFWPLQAQNILSPTNITHFHSSSTYFIDKQYLLLRWSLLWWWRTKIGRQNFRLLITSFQFTVALLVSQIWYPLLQFSSRRIILTAKLSW